MFKKDRACQFGDSTGLDYDEDKGKRVLLNVLLGFAILLFLLAKSNENSKKVEPCNQETKGENK